MSTSNNSKPLDNLQNVLEYCLASSLLAVLVTLVIFGELVPDRRFLFIPVRLCLILFAQPLCSRKDANLGVSDEVENDHWP